MPKNPQKRFERVSIYAVMNSYPPEELKNKVISIYDKEGTLQDWIIMGVDRDHHRMMCSPIISPGVYHPDVTVNISWDRLVLIMIDDGEEEG